MLYLDRNLWPHSMLITSNFRRLQCSDRSLHQSSYGTLWNACQLKLASVKMWPDPFTHYYKLNHTRHPEVKKLYYFNIAIEEDDKNCLQQVATSETEICLLTVYTGWERSCSPQGLYFSIFRPPPPRAHRDRQRTLTRFCWFHLASPLERHQAWQFRKAQGWVGTACMCQKRNEELLSFGSDPTITTWYRCQGKLQSRVQRVHGTHGACMGVSAHHSLCRGCHPRSPTAPSGVHRGKKGQ